jgi:hypothetical protein
VYCRNLLVVLLLLGIGGCSTDRPTARAVHCRIQIDSSLPESAEAGVRIWMGAVPGDLFGRYSNESVLDLVVDKPESFTLSLPVVESGLARQALVARSGALQVEPADTRIARLATLGGLSGVAESRFFLSGFRDPKTHEVVVLFYANRPCVIRGTFSAGHQYTLHIAHKGLSWIKMPDDKASDDSSGRDGEPELTEPRSDLIYSMKEIRR